MQTILVIDDDESLRDTIGMLLESEGFRAVLAGDGKSGLDQAMVSKPNLILVDLRLPVIQWSRRVQAVAAIGGGNSNHRVKRRRR